MYQLSQAEKAIIILTEPSTEAIYARIN